MHAVSCATTENPDKLSLELDHAFVVDGSCLGFCFRLSFSIDAVQFSDLVAVSNDQFSNFVAAIVTINETLEHTARMDDRDSTIGRANGFVFEITPWENRGYLLVKVAIQLSQLSQFSGGIIVEPAQLNSWAREFQSILTEKEPAIDFYGDWSTKLPLPERLVNSNRPPSSESG